MVADLTTVKPYDGDGTDIDLFVDYETHWTTEYSLRRMTPVEYILSPQFETLGAGVTIGDMPPIWIDGPRLSRFFATVPWERTRFISHNAVFDGCITAWRYGHVPKRYCCTMSMAKAWYYHRSASSSLAAIAKLLGWSDKMDTVRKLQGHTFQSVSMDKPLYDEMCVYGVDDVEKCRSIYNTLLRREGFPRAQLRIIDMVVKMAAQPKFLLEPFLLHEHLAEVIDGKEKLLYDAGLHSREGLMSDAKLAQMLLQLGVDPPRKTSKTTGVQVFAFAKSDKPFTDLLDDPNPMVQAVVAARLGVKTTIEETRTQRFINISRVQWPAGILPLSMPVSLRYSGAHTHRFSGDWQVNQQNLGKKSKIRDAIQAPPGHLIVAADSSQVEARGAAVFANQEDLVESFALGRDVYAEFASAVYHRPITKETDPHERQVGKVGVLSLGYGAAAMTFNSMLRNNGITMPLEEAGGIVNAYRGRYANMPVTWRFLGELIPELAHNTNLNLQWGPVLIQHQRIILPSGLPINYYNLRQETDQTNGRLQWVYTYGKQVKRLYGAKLFENIIQAVCFGIIMDAAVLVDDFTKGSVQLALQGHDELAYVVPKEIADEFGKLLQWCMRQRPSYLPGIPLDCEWGTGTSYGGLVKHK